MNQQFCPQVGDFVSARKCNQCNMDMVSRTGTCCTYIDCLRICDWKDKEQCAEYLAAVMRLESKKHEGPESGRGQQDRTDRTGQG